MRGLCAPSAMLPGVKAKPRIAIVGPGNLGAALAVSLGHAGFTIASLVARSGGKSFGRAKKVARQVKAKPLLPGENLTAEVVWFCVPDSEIFRAARLFADTGSWKGRVVLHSSGALTSDELDPLRQKGAAVASVHPLMTFAGSSRPELRGVPFAIEGDAAAVHTARKIVRALGGKSYPIHKQHKAAYHAWGTFASPLLTALLATTEQVASLAGIRGRESRLRMIPILSQTLANYASSGAARGFSGPIIRGDIETVKRHLRVLRSAPAVREVYCALARAALQYLPAKNKTLLRRLLDGRR